MDKDGKYTSDVMKKLVSNHKENISSCRDGIKQSNTISLAEILKDIDNKGENVDDILNDIKNNKINVGMDKDAISLLTSEKCAKNEDIKKLLTTIGTINIDVASIKDCTSADMKKLQENGVNIGKVYVNSGYDRAANAGYNANTYKKIVENAEKMHEKAMSNFKEDLKKKEGIDFDSLSDKEKEHVMNSHKEARFMAIYNLVVSNAKYDYNASDKDDSTRNLEGFFVDRKSVCAGTALALKSLCDIDGIECEYVQGDGLVNNKEEYHAWVKANIDGKWYNADPTWDANEKENYKYCLKSDKDFVNHKEDKTYKPNYMRGKGVSKEYSDNYVERSSDDDYSKSTSDLRGLYESGIKNKEANPNFYNQLATRPSSTLFEAIIELILGLFRHGEGARVPNITTVKRVANASASDRNKFIEDLQKGVEKDSPNKEKNDSENAKESPNTEKNAADKDDKTKSNNQNKNKTNEDRQRER